jgi:hypothetical protein
MCEGESHRYSETVRRKTKRQRDWEMGRHKNEEMTRRRDGETARQRD